MKTSKEIREEIEFLEWRINLCRNALKEESDMPIWFLRNRLDDIDQMEIRRGFLLGILI
jgi:hypothetical protein